MDKKLVVITRGYPWIKIFPRDSSSMLPGAYSRSPDLPLPSFQKKKQNKKQKNNQRSRGKCRLSSLLSLSNFLSSSYKLPLTVSRKMQESTKDPFSFIPFLWVFLKTSVCRTVHTKLAMYIYISYIVSSMHANRIHLDTFINTRPHTFKRSSTHTRTHAHIYECQH